MAEALSNREELLSAAAAVSYDTQESGDAGDRVAEDAVLTHINDPSDAIAGQEVNWSLGSDNADLDLLADEPTMIIRPIKKK